VGRYREEVVRLEVEVTELRARQAQQEVTAEARNRAHVLRMQGDADEQVKGVHAEMMALQASLDSSEVITFIVVTNLTNPTNPTYRTTLINSTDLSDLSKPTEPC
jgi:hypothetical protein